MYFRILLPLKLWWTPTYSSEETLLPGQRVRVSFAHREYIGIVLSEDDGTSYDPSRIQPVLGIEEGLPPIGEKEMELWKFISEYYLCSLGEVYKAAYPQAKTKSELSLSRKNGPLTTADDTRTEEGIIAKPEVFIGSSRTETYLKKASEVLGRGKEVLVLVPETALGDSLEKKFKAEFKDRLMLYNSRHTAARKREVACRVRAGEPAVILGTRSALFLPFRNLGLIIIDEEQDPSYKQTEPNPRYNGRDTAVILSRIHNAEIILGTSSPAFETLANIRSGKYTVTYGSRPEAGTVSLIDLQAEKRKNGVKGAISYALENRISGCKGKICLARGWEKEEEVQSFAESRFPEKTITTGTLYSVQNGDENFAMIAILQADILFDKSDFRSDEKAVQTITRIAEKTEDVVIQTAKSDHPVFKMLTGEIDVTPLLDERRTFNLPPFSRLVDVTVKDANPKRLALFSRLLSEKLMDATRMDKEGSTTFRVTLSRSRKAALEKAGILRSVTDIEKKYRYNGHIHIDVDPA